MDELRFMQGLDEGINVLAVDDDRDLLEITELYLEKRENIDVKTTVNPHEAANLVEEEFYDVVVSDYNMPGMNGLELLEEVRTKRPNKPFILFTGKETEEIADEAVSKNITDYLQKGSGRNAKDKYNILSNRIENAVNERRMEQRARLHDQAVHESSNSIVYTDTDRRIFFVNDAYEENTGFDREDVLGMRVGDVRPEGCYGGFRPEEFEKVLEGEVFQGTVETCGLNDAQIFEQKVFPIYRENLSSYNNGGDEVVAVGAINNSG